ncbi:hypothetical protein TNCV_2371501 [Trichonephila clavipes]|nr:hypothetical protein TNCV_2371501 [Trichonephila clavipes]
MNRDDSDLSSLAEEDDYQSDNGNEIDNDGEDQDKKPSSTPSLAEDENDLQTAELRLAFHIKQLVTMKFGTCLKWLGTGIIEVGARMRSARP